MNLFFLFFILSGFCSLLYQVAWLRIAMADFGVTSLMVSLVLSVFMAGLSCGSWVGGRVAGFGLKKSSSQLRLYAVLEAVIGLSGLVSVPFLNYGRDLLNSSGLFVWGSGSYYLASGAVVFLGLFPFCVCMGATFPVAMAALRRAFPEKSSTSFSYLYLANLLGAVLGCTSTAFVMIELLGFRGTMLVAVVLNMSIALTAFIMSGRLMPATDSNEGSPFDTGAEFSPPPEERRLYAVLLISGLASMALEVVWVRQFTLYLGPVVYTFALILALFLVANYSGSLIYRKSCLNPTALQNNPLLAALIAMAGFTALFALLGADYRLAFPNSLTGGLLRVAVGTVPFGLTLGFITSLVVDRLSAGDPERAGRAYALNTVGCILGPLVAGFVLLPLIGERWSTMLLAALFFLPPLLLLKGVNPEKVHRFFSVRVTCSLLVVAVIGSLLIVSFTKGYEEHYPGSVVLRDHTATVIAAGTGWDRQLLVNGYGMTELTPITKLMVHLPMAMHATPPKNGLVLCFGMGTSFRSMLSWGVPATVVELVPSIPKLFGYYHHDAETLFADPNARVIIDDARRYLSRTAERFDVILVDPPPPIEAAASSLLYSVEFYRTVVARLAPGGIFQQWTDIEEPYLLASITKSLTAVFPFVRAFKPVEGLGVHYIASMQPIPDKSPSELAAELSPGAAADLVEWGPFATPVGQFEAMLSREFNVVEILNTTPGALPVTDDRPVNEYFLVRRYVRPSNR